MAGDKWGDFAKWGQLMVWYDCSYTIGISGQPKRIEVYISSESIFLPTQSIRFRAGTSTIEQ